MNLMLSTLPSIQQACCLANAAPGDLNAGATGCSGGYPTATDQCSKGCKAVMGPFWQKCGGTLSASWMPGLDGMASFDQTCKAMPTCDMNSMMTGLMHVQDVCCSGGTCGGVYRGADTACSTACAVPFETFLKDCGKTIKIMGMPAAWRRSLRPAWRRSTRRARVATSATRARSGAGSRRSTARAAAKTEEACKDDEVTPVDCSTECALTFAPFGDVCSDMISAQYEDGLVHRLARFKEKCLDQDALGLVEYGKVLIDKGCALDFGRAARGPAQPITSG
jgi:hypothetical protein